MPIAPKAKGSLGGVPFYTIEHGTGFGHRQPTHALPFQDKGAASVKLGRAPREFSISAVLIGDDYRAQRAKLIDVIEKGGPTLLVHPEYGRVLVICDQRITLRESTAEVNLCRIEFRATESADKPPQVSALDTGSALKAASLKARGLTADSFANPATGLKDSISDFVKSAHLDVLDNVITDLAKINGTISSVLAIPSGFASQLDSISRQLSTLINTPQRLFNELDATMRLLAQATRRLIGPDGQDAELADLDATSLSLRRGKMQLRTIAPFASLGSASRPVPDIDTAERRDQAQGQRAIQQHMRASGLLNMADAVADAPFDSKQDVEAVRDALANALADLADAEPGLDAPIAAALKETAASVLLHLNTIAGSIAEVVEYTPADTLPIEVITWTLYADAERADEIWLRNPSIKHPGMVQGRVAIEVSSA